MMYQEGHNNEFTPLVGKSRQKWLTMCLIIRDAQKSGLLQAYEKDFNVHDYNAIANDNPDKFIWIIRENGTHLFPIEKGKEGKQIMAVMVGTLRYYEHDVHKGKAKIYLANGLQFIKINSPIAAIGKYMDYSGIC